MNYETDDTKQDTLQSAWVQDALKLQKVPDWAKWLAIGLTIISCVLYSGLNFLIAEYRVEMAESIRELPIFTRIVLNIYQPFLVVFIIISLSLLILLYLKVKRPRGSYKPFLVLIIINCLFSVILLGLSIIKVS